MRRVVVLTLLVVAAVGAMACPGATPWIADSAPGADPGTSPDLPWLSPDAAGPDATPAEVAWEVDATTDAPDPGEAGDPGTDAAKDAQADAPACAAPTLSFVDPLDDLGKATAGSSVFNLAMGYTSSRDLKVAVRCGTTPLLNIATRWEMINQTVETCQLAAGMVYTDDNGQAVDKLTNVVQKLEQFQVKVSVDGDDTIEPRYFNVVLEPGGYAPLTVGFADYQGAYPMLDSADLRLFKQAANGKPKCADFASVVDVSKAQATVTSPTVSISGTYPFVNLPNLQQDQAQQYTVVGLARAGTGPTRAWACNDADGKVEYGSPTYVELTLKDLPPNLVGTYDVTSTFDLVSGLPPAVATSVSTVAGFFQNPTAEILLLACKLGGSNSTLGSFCGYLFVDPANPDINQLTGTGDIAAQIINAILVGILESNCPYKTDPTLCGKIYWTGKDVSGILGSFQILSTVTFNKEPDGNGFIPAQYVKEVWHSVRLRWTLGKNCLPGDPDCGWQKFSLSQIPGIEDAISGSFDATVLPAWTLTIAPHKLDLKYGTLINFAIEKWLLPKLFGDGSDGLPAVDCYGAMIGSLMAGKACLKTSDCCSATGTCADCCQQFAVNLSNQAGGSLTANLIAGACEALVSTGDTYLRNLLIGLDGTANSLTLGTQATCPLYDVNADLTVDTLGRQDNPCVWDAQWTLGSASYPPKGTFWGSKK